MTASKASSHRASVAGISIRFAGRNRSVENKAPTALLLKSQYFFARALLSLSRGGFMFPWAMNRACTS